MKWNNVPEIKSTWQNIAYGLDFFKFVNTVSTDTKLIQFRVKFQVQFISLRNSN